jgi:WD40 repeat protein
MHRPRITTAVLAAAISLAAAGPAAADSLVYVKDRNIWVANPDGTGNRQVTFDGREYSAYIDPAQAADGTIWAGKGQEIVKLDQQGTVLASWDPPAATDSTSYSMDEVPQDLAVSPDGKRLAYSMYRYSCPVGVSCGARTTTVFSWADRRTETKELGYELGVQSPQWVGDRVLVFGGAGSHVNFDRPGSGDYDHVHWFDDPDREDLSDGELSPQGDRLATLRSYGSNLHLQIWKVANTTDVPAAACSAGPDSSLSAPTWAPDGKRLAFEVKEGIQILSLPSVETGCPGSSESPVIIPGGTNPDWGPAEVQSAYTISADVPKGTRLAGALRNGLRLNVTSNVAGTLSGPVLVAGKKVGSGSAQLPQGTGKLTLRFTKQARTALARKKKVAFHVDLTFTYAPGRTIPVNGTVKVKR